MRALLLPFQFWVVLFSCSVLAVASTTATDEASATALPTDEHGDYDGSDLIEWIRSDPDGDVHPSLRIGREVPGDPTSLRGLFVKPDAAEPIEKGDVVAQIPWSRMITPGEKYSPHRFDSCRSVYTLARELRLGDGSKMAPYVRYLLSQPRGTMPGEWTGAGKDFLLKVTDHSDLPPYEETWRNVFEDEWVRDCSGSDADDVERAAYWLASSRDEDTLMVPIYDMANHSNDPKKLNTLSYKPNKVGDSFRFVASRKIEPGEQVYNSYNRCNTCSHVDPSDCETFSFYRTSDLFVHFGFVEDYPQSWEFDPGDDDDSSDDDTEFEFCLEGGDDDGSSSGEPVALWDNDDEVPDGEDARWLSLHYSRLKKLLDQKDTLEEELVRRGDGSGDEEDEKKMTRWEWESTWRYHGALSRAIDAAIRSAEDDSSDDDSSDDDSRDEL